MSANESRWVLDSESVAHLLAPKVRQPRWALEAVCGALMPLETALHALIDGEPVCEGCLEAAVREEKS